MSGASFTLGVLGLDEMMLSSLAVPVDMLRVAEQVARSRDPGTGLRLSTVLVSASGPRQIPTVGGQKVAALDAASTPIDTLLVPGVMHVGGSDLIGRLAGLDREIALLQSLHARGVPLASACSGGFLLGEAGVLDGRRATTSWWLDRAFRKRFPRVRLQVEEILVEDGTVTTTGAATAVDQYMLQLVARVGGADLARQASRILLIDADRQSQAPYISRALEERPRHSLTERAERFVQRELHRELSVSELAAHCGTSERSLLRRFHSEYGLSPLAHIQRLRVERAKALLETTHLSFEEVMERCGYRDVSSFRKLFKRATRMTPADYRERFRLRPH
ncbi:GlxA family transcriptional regulator [Alkalisalibacterium limincola]|uniref:Helix-turn-helix domain-containing protein n=1 Tax=Alkalisalibacterium limincola TaxID=2699169 RepID=A0A5C8KND4_9GAMM|nr:helix-turn-helix domain-containing protein [Alkalisalibacterium limincola]TXK60964.1 helix-turn-helix domain-containing protein [Alkalisalibacterium limincola]